MRGGRVCAVEWIYFFVPTDLGGTFATGCWVGEGLPGLLGVVGVLGLLGLLGPVLRLLVLGVLVLGVVALGARGLVYGCGRVIPAGWFPIGLW